MEILTPAPAPKRSWKRFLAFAGVGLFLVLFFAGFTWLMIRAVQVGEGSTLLRVLGATPAQGRSFLLGFLSLLFGALGLFFFVLVAVGAFRGKRGLKLMLFSLLPLLLTLAGWFLLYGFVARLGLGILTAEIRVTRPLDISRLQAPVEITFSSESVLRSLAAEGASAQNVEWDFEGDGTFETVARDYEIVHLYPRSGRFNVALRVTLAGQSARVYNQFIDIPEAVFAADPSDGAPPLLVQFDASNLLLPGAKIETFDWDFQDDGRYDVSGKDAVKPRFTFDRLGTYRVHLRMVDENRNVENYYRNIIVAASANPLVTAVIETTPGLKGPAPLSLRFDAGRSSSLRSTLTQFDWSFGDGATQAGKTVEHTFIKPGTYTVTLQARDSTGQAGMASADVEAQGSTSAPQAKATFEPALSADGILTGDTPFKVLADASPSRDVENDIVDYEWEFDGDGKADAQGQKATYTYEKAGDFVMTLTLKDSTGLSGQVTYAVKVTEAVLKAAFKATPEEGTAPLIVKFDGSSSSAFKGKITSYEWDFGDGTPKSLTGAVIEHKYAQVGTYMVKLKVQNSEGASAEAVRQIVVREVPLAACFTPSRVSGKAPLAVTFDPQCSTGAITRFAWNFGDGAENATRKPSHTFQEPGMYTVTLEVGDEKNNISTVSSVIAVEGGDLQ